MAEDTCIRCGNEVWPGQKFCNSCKAFADDFDTRQAELNREKALASMAQISLSTLPPNFEYEFVGLVSGSQSKLAFWGLSKQATRIDSALEEALDALRYSAALLGAEGVYGIQMALNNSTGSALTAGSSEAVVLFGTAVRRKS